jgi:hypothetical protein
VLLSGQPTRRRNLKYTAHPRPVTTYSADHTVGVVMRGTTMAWHVPQAIPSVLRRKCRASTACMLLTHLEKVRLLGKQPRWNRRNTAAKSVLAGTMPMHYLQIGILSLSRLRGRMLDARARHSSTRPSGWYRADSEFVRIPMQIIPLRKRAPHMDIAHGEDGRTLPKLSANAKQSTSA